jgi:DNA polymerase
MLRKYIQQQLDLGFRELYLPFDSPRRKSPLRPDSDTAGRVHGASRRRAAEPDSSLTQHKIASKHVGSVTALPIEQFAESLSLEQLQRTIQGCQRCPLWKTRTNLVFGVGNPHADIMFIGEAPGRDEDLQGIPFVGRAGKLLDKMLIEVGLERKEVYIANILKSRPPENRDPMPEEVDACEPYLHAQIKLIKPKIICSLGRIAAQTLLKTKMTLGEMRGRWFEFLGAKFMVTYHPAAILRTMGNYDSGIGDLRRMLKELENLPN